MCRYATNGNKPFFYCPDGDSPQLLFLCCRWTKAKYRKRSASIHGLTVNIIIGYISIVGGWSQCIEMALVSFCSSAALLVQ